MKSFEPQPDPDELYCNDPTHGADCTCGAEPDREYEQAIDA